jgi:hypothetical protein
VGESEVVTYFGLDGLFQRSDFRRRMIDFPGKLHQNCGCLWGKGKQEGKRVGQKNSGAKGISVVGERLARFWP